METRSFFRWIPSAQGEHCLLRPALCWQRFPEAMAWSDANAY